MLCTSSGGTGRFAIACGAKIVRMSDPGVCGCVRERGRGREKKKREEREEGKGWEASTEAGREGGREQGTGRKRATVD
eukprot:6194376-Pleurochrysis_carterae.AAC.2